MDERRLPKAPAGRPKNPAFAAEITSGVTAGAGRASVLARDAGDVIRHVLGVLALQEPARHAHLARPADLDRVQDPLLLDLADPVEVRSGDAARIDRGEAVAARAL